MDFRPHPALKSFKKPEKIRKIGLRMGIVYAIIHRYDLIRRDEIVLFNSNDYRINR